MRSIDYWDIRNRQIAARSQADVNLSSEQVKAMYRHEGGPEVFDTYLLDQALATYKDPAFGGIAEAIRAFERDIVAGKVKRGGIYVGAKTLAYYFFIEANGLQEEAAREAFEQIPHSTRWAHTGDYYLKFDRLLKRGLSLRESDHATREKLVNLAIDKLHEQGRGFESAEVKNNWQPDKTAAMPHFTQLPPLQRAAIDDAYRAWIKQVITHPIDQGLIDSHLLGDELPNIAQALSTRLLNLHPTVFGEVNAKGQLSSTRRDAQRTDGVAHVPIMTGPYGVNTPPEKKKALKNDDEPIHQTATNWTYHAPALTSDGERLGHDDGPTRPAASQIKPRWRDDGRVGKFGEQGRSAPDDHRADIAYGLLEEPDAGTSHRQLAGHFHGAAPEHREVLNGYEPWQDELGQDEKTFNADELLARLKRADAIHQDHEGRAFITPDAEARIVKHGLCTDVELMEMLLAQNINVRPYGDEQPTYPASDRALQGRVGTPVKEHHQG